MVLGTESYEWGVLYTSYTHPLPHHDGWANWRRWVWRRVGGGRVSALAANGHLLSI